MAQTFEDAGKFGKEFLDGSMKSFTALSRGAQTIATEASDYARKSVENNSAAFEKLIGVKSFEKAVEVQSELARQSYEGFVAQSTRMGELFAELAREAYKPFESILAKSH